MLPGSYDLLDAQMSEEGRLAASSFLVRLQASVNANDLTSVAAMIRYPLRVDGKVTVQSPEDFVRLSQRIITAPVRAAILGQTPESLVLTSEGIVLGNGSVWLDSRCSLAVFNSECHDDGIQIIAIDGGTK